MRDSDENQDENGSPHYADGAIVPVTHPDIFFDDPPGPNEALRGIDTSQLLDLLITGAIGTEDIGARALVVAMMVKRPVAPKSKSEFALWLNVSPPTARKIFSSILQCLRSEILTSLSPPPHQ